MSAVLTPRNSRPSFSFRDFISSFMLTELLKGMALTMPLSSSVSMLSLIHI